MANYSNLKTAIENAVDWNNGDNEITGQNLLDILETIIDSLGAKYKFADVATPSSSISTPDEPLFYLAGAGTYANFSGLTVSVQRGTLAIFYYDTAWHWTSVRTDSDAFFNVNQYLEAPSTTYTKATGRNAVPEALRSKGMIITYLTTNGWIIEQNLSTSGTWNADANWQTIGPVSVSQNTLTIGGENKGAVPDNWVENPEWVKVVTDKDGKILYGVKTDGNFYFGVGCPPQVQEYVQSQIDAIGIDALLATKVDKVLGMSLIDADFADSQSVVENPEFLDVKTDSQGKILEATKNNGDKEFCGEVKAKSVVTDELDLSASGKASLKDDLGVDNKLDKPQISTDGHIVVFNENGEVEDSGYSIDNLPSGEVFPEGGQDGDVLKTDGQGNRYWDGSTAPTQEQVDSATNDWLNVHGGAIAQIENNNEYDLCIADENGNIGEGIKNGNLLVGNYKSNYSGDQWRGKLWYAYGTSLTAPKSGKYPFYVRRMIGMTLVNYGEGGQGIVKDSQDASKGANLDAICNITDGKLDADLITIEVGANDEWAAIGDIYDYTHDNTFCSALNTAIQYLLANTTAQIVVMSSSPAIYGVTNWQVDRNIIYNIDHTSGPDNHTWLDTVNAIEQVCKANRVHYIGWENAGLGIARMLATYDKYVIDQIHHSDLMGMILGEYIWSQLRNIPIWHTQTVEPLNS